MLISKRFALSLQPSLPLRLLVLCTLHIATIALPGSTTKVEVTAGGPLQGLQRAIVAILILVQFPCRACSRGTPLRWPAVSIPCRRQWDENRISYACVNMAMRRAIKKFSMLHLLVYLERPYVYLTGAILINVNINVPLVILVCVGNFIKYNN
ncbi:hypothetical protein F4801DRAFT_198492 [Xylaria longipes]|nr:hypothetical protein F4801DRAFT_198492 [Xylaria longipes]